MTIGGNIMLILRNFRIASFFVSIDTAVETAFAGPGAVGDRFAPAASTLAGQTASFIKPLLAEQQRHVSWVGAGRHSCRPSQSDWTPLSP